MKRIALFSLASVLFVGCNDATQPVDDELVVHELKASPSTTHISFFDASLEPVLRIESGDVVRLETATGNPRWFENAGVPRDQIPPELYAVYEGYESTGRGDHTLNGPIFVNGAELGDVSEIRILSVDVRLSIAGQGIGSRLFPGEIDANVSRVHWIDLVNRTVEFAPGVVVPIKPFWGVIGVAPPPEMGRVRSGAPNFFGGNMDNRDLGPGSVLGEFKGSSQHLRKEEELRWRQASADGRIELCVRRWVHPVVPRWGAGSIGRGFGKKLLEGCRARSRRWQPACLPLLERAGFANVVACHLSVFVLCRGATYRSSSEKRLRFFKPAVVAYVRSPGSCAAHRRRSRENCGGTQQREVETSSIEPRPPNGMPIGERSVRKLPNSLRTAN